MSINAIGRTTAFLVIALASVGVVADGGHQQRPPSAPPPFEGTYWKAVELAGKALSIRGDKREAHLIFQPDGRMTGSDSCNRINGSYKRDGESLMFGEIIATRMACPDTGDTERAFREALKDVNRWRTGGNRLELFDTAGTRRAVFEARTAT